MSTRCWMIGSVASSLSIVAAIVSRSASFWPRWPSSEASLARYSSVCLSRNCCCMATSVGACARRRLKCVFRIVTVAQRCAQSRNVQLRGNEIASDMLLLRLRHGRIEFDQHVTRLDALAIADMNGAHDAGFEGLYQLNAAARDDFSGCRRHDIDMPKRCPDQRQAEERDDGRADRVANRRRRRLDDLQCRRQEGELIRFRRSRGNGNEMTFLVAAIAALADFMDATLHSVERRIAPAPANQFVVSAILDEAAMVERQDAVGEANRGQAVGDDENRAPCGDLRHVLLDDPLAFIVERARRFVKDQDPRLAQECARNRNALALAAGQAAAAFADDRVVALGQLQDEVVSAGERSRSDHAVDRHAGLGKRDVVADRTVEQNVLLQHDAQLAAQPRAVHHGEIDAVDEHASALGDVETLDELGERALSRAGWADNADNLASRNAETDVVQHLRPVDAIAKVSRAQT